MWTNPNQNKQTNTKTNKTLHWIKSLEIRGLCHWSIRNCWNSASGHELAVALMSHTLVHHSGGCYFLEPGQGPSVCNTMIPFYRKALMALNTQASGGNNWHLESNASGVLSNPLILPSSPLPHLWIRATIYRASHPEAASEYALPSRWQGSLHDVHAMW